MDKKKKEQKVTSTDIKIALSQFRPKDYFLTEVKNGSTYFPPPQGLLKFDGVGIRRSYTQPCITIYEVKVSRGDFLQDNKWKLYFQYCNEFYFVVPKGLIDKSELPDNVGLIYYNPETKKLLTKQKSKYWECENPWEMYQYIIYSRLDEERTPFCKDRTEYARYYLEGKMTNHSIGDALRSKFAQEIQRLEREVERIEDYKKNEEKYQKICDTLRKHGISTARHRTAEEIIEDLDKALSSGMDMGFVRYCKREFEYMLNEFEKMEKKMMETPKQEKVNNQSSKDIIIGLAISFWIMVNVVGFAAFGAEKIIKAMANVAINNPGYLLFSTILIMFLLCSAVPFALLLMTAWLSSWFEAGEK